MIGQNHHIKIRSFLPVRSIIRRIFMDTVDRIVGEQPLLDYLDRAGVVYSRIEHPAVFTCEEASRYRPEVPGLETKNLFLRDERGDFYLVMTDCAKRLDLKNLGQRAGARKLQFGMPAQLDDCLGLTPGSVTVFGLVNDPGRRVELLVDAEFWPAAAYLCHPMVNTSTLVLDHASLARFLHLTGHTPRVVEIPVKA